MNIDLLKKEISCIIISVNKNRLGHVRELHSQICETVSEIKKIKMILYVEHTVDPNDLTTALWRFCNNLDPKRDHFAGDCGTARASPHRHPRGLLMLAGSVRREFLGRPLDWLAGGVGEM